MSYLLQFRRQQQEGEPGGGGGGEAPDPPFTILSKQQLEAT